MTGPAVYVDLKDVPLDTPPPDIGDGGTVTPGSTTKRAAVERLKAAMVSNVLATQENLVIPFTRLIRFGVGGQDVKGVKRAIWRANGLKLTPFSAVFGPVAVRQLKDFQHRHSLVADGQVGPVTLAALAPYFDRYAFLLYEGYPPGLSPIQAKRQKALAYLLWGYNNRASIYYVQARPMGLLNDLEHLPVSEDCSTFYTKMAKFAGWPDPNGFSYNGVGNTTSLCAHGREIPVGFAQPGDGVFYSNPAHVGGYVGSSRIISLGSSAGPSLTAVDYRSDYAFTRTYF